MISVPSHRLQLSGSKVLFSIFIVTFLASCSILQSGSKTPDRKAPTKKETQKVPGAPMDTAVWTKKPDEPRPLPEKTTEKDIEDGYLKASYDVALLMPFHSEKAKYWTESVGTSQLDDINFYCGIQMAIEDLRAKNVRLNVSVYDSEESGEKTEEVLKNSRIKNTDLIIGPKKKVAVKLAADFGRKNKCTVVTPWYKGTDVTIDNPYYVQSGPSLEAHCFAITDHILKNYPHADVMIVGRDSEKSRFKYFHEAHQKISSSPLGFEDVIANGPEEIDLLIEEGKFSRSNQKVIILPYYRNGAYIIEVLQKLVMLDHGSSFVVYGFPQWQEIESLFDYFEKFNIYISSDGYLDTESYKISSFNSRFFNKYGTFPLIEAYEGYDHMMYFGSQLAEHGTGISKNLMRSESPDLLYLGFDFRKMRDGDIFLEDVEDFDYYVNKHVQVLRYDNYKFHPAY